MSDEYRWLFIGDVPLLYRKRRVARQWYMEQMIDHDFILAVLNVKSLWKTVEKAIEEKVRGYIR